MDILTFTAASGEDYIHMGIEQEQRLRAHGYKGDWRVLTDQPERFSGDGIRVPYSERDRTLNRGLKARITQLMDVSRYDIVIFIEADVMPGPELQRTLDSIPLNKVTVQRGSIALSKLDSSLPSMPAPWAGFIAVPQRFVRTFYRLFLEAHSKPKLGYEEVELYHTLERLSMICGAIAWGYADGVTFWPHVGGLTHHQGNPAKREISPLIRERQRREEEHFLNGPLEEVIGKMQRVL
jgi:hypothetical protein